MSKGDDMDQMEYDPDDNDDSGPAFLATFETCQICCWQGLVGDGIWTCSGCKTAWEPITFMVPTADMDDFCGKAADALGGYFQRIRPHSEQDGA